MLFLPANRSRPPAHARRPVYGAALACASAWGVALGGAFTSVGALEPMIFIELENNSDYMVHIALID